MSTNDSPTPNSPSAEPRLRRRRFDGALVVLFVISLCVPMAGRLTGIAAPYDAAFEQRHATAFPQIEFRQRGPIWLPRKGNLLAFPGQFEAYFADHLGFRADLVRLYTKTCAVGLVPPVLANSSGSGGKGGPVQIGREGWLYYNGDCVDNYRNLRPFTETELDAWVAALHKRRDWLAQRNIRYLFFVAPDKATIYPEYVPSAVNRIRPDSRLDQLLARLAKTGAVPTLDLRPALLAAKLQRQVYYQTDSHWNAHGSWVGYQEIHRALQSPHWPPPSLFAYRIVPQASHMGDLAKMLPSSVWSESGAVAYEPLQPPAAQFRRRNEPIGDGNYAEVERSKNPHAPNGRAFVFHDSFFTSVTPFFSEDWQHVTYVTNGNPFPAELIDRERPELVIDEWVERKLLGSPPKNPPLLDRPNAALPTAEQPTTGLRR